MRTPECIADLSLVETILFYFKQVLAVSTVIGGFVLAVFFCIGAHTLYQGWRKRRK